MRKYGKSVAGILFFLILLFSLRTESYASEEHPVIVIDPGHGGKNLGADYNGFLEKEMNLAVANAMYEELSKYENVTVYLTHNETDTDMSIQARADFAASVEADFLYCLHFNMSPDNKLFGSEVWISAFGEPNRQGYRFGSVQMAEMAERGLFLRGIKTRLGDNGTDYYGILRFCTEYDIPAALIEHCHVDNENDVSFCDSEEELVAFGIADATAVAKYFGLKSDELKVDYSDYKEMPDTTQGVLYMQPDTTAPDICMIEADSFDLDKKTVTVRVTGCDYDTPMLYYSYSIDGGMTYSPYLPWEGTDMLHHKSADTFTLTIDIPDGISPQIMVRGINQYDLITESNVLSGYPVFLDTPEEIIEPKEPAIDANDKTPDAGEEGKAGFHAPQKETGKERTNDFSMMQFLQICLGIASLFFVALLISNLVMAGKRRHRKKKRR